MCVWLIRRVHVHRFAARFKALFLPHQPTRDTHLLDAEGVAALDSKAANAARVDWAGESRDARRHGRGSRGRHAGHRAGTGAGAVARRVRLELSQLGATDVATAYVQ